MIKYVLLILSVLTASGKALFAKAVGVSNTSKKQTLIMNFQAFVVSFVCSLVVVIPKFSQLFTISTYSLLLALLFALSVATTQITQSKAMGLGTSSVVSLIYSFGFIVPIVYSMFVWNESVSITQCIGLVFLIVSLVLVVKKKEEKKQSKGKLWFYLALIAMLGSGINGVIQKTHQRSSFSFELEIFLVYAMLFCAVFTGVLALITKDDTPKTEEKKSWIRSLLPPIGLGICVCALNFVNLRLSGQLPSIIFFPVYNVGNLLLTTVLSAFIFKDKTSRMQNVGLIVGIVAILIIGLT